MIAKFAGWTVEFAALFVRTVLCMLVFTLIRTTFSKVFESFEMSIYDLGGPAGSLTRLIPVVLIFGIQWWASFKLTMYLANLYYGDEDAE